MRYAIYYCPAADTALGRLGHDWLAASSPSIRLPGIRSERRDALLTDVRRYGWHATVRAPFTPIVSAGHDEVHTAVAMLAQNFASFELTLRLDRLAGFLCLRPMADGGPERLLAAACLDALHPFCASLTDEALQHRRAGLAADELALLQKHGYPYVLDRYRFHLTLSAPATEIEERAMRQWLQPRVDGLRSTRIESLAICREATPGAAFELLERIALLAPDMEHTA